MFPHEFVLTVKISNTTNLMLTRPAILENKLEIAFQYLGFFSVMETIVIDQGVEGELGWEEVALV